MDGQQEEIVKNKGSVTNPDISSRLGVTATTDMVALPGVLGCSFDRLRTGSPCDVPFRYASEPIPRYRGTVARWHAHLRGLATAIHEISGLKLIGSQKPLGLYGNLVEIEPGQVLLPEKQLAS